MHADALTLLKRKIDRLSEESLAEMLTEESKALNGLDLRRRASISDSFHRFQASAGACLQRHLEAVRQHALATAQEAGKDFGRTEMAELEAILAKTIPEPALYVERFRLFCDAIERHFGRAGMAIALQGYQPDLTAAKVHTGCSAQVSRFRRDVANDLETLVQRNETLAATSNAPKMGALDQFNEAVKLKPGFMGFSIDLNWVLGRLLKRNKKTT